MGRITFKGIVRFMFSRAIEGIIVLIILFMLPNVPPFCKFERPYKVEPTKPLEGKLAINERLNNAEHWHEGEFKGPESFAIHNDEIYTSLQSGDIIKITSDNQIVKVARLGKSCNNEFEESICGRPLGLAFDRNGNLYAADAYYGIFKINIKTGAKELLVGPDVVINEKKPKIFNSLAVTATGDDIYWTDSSTDFPLEDGLFDLFADGTGRVIHYNTKTKRNTLLLEDIHFANGILLSKNEDYLFISETGRSQIHRYYLNGPKKGKSDILVNGLPGVTDNLTPDGQGGVIVSLVSNHDKDTPSAFQIFGPFPRIRKIISRILALIELTFKGYDYIYPNQYSKMGVHFVGHFSSAHHLIPQKRSTILRVSENGEILDSLHATNGRLNSICEARIYKNQLLLGSPFNEYIGRVNLSDIGWSHLEEKSVREPVVKQKQADKVAESPKVTTTPKPATQTTKASKPNTPQPTQAPKPTPTRTQAPKQTPPPTKVPNQTPPPTKAPKQTPPPTQPPKQAPTIKQSPPTPAAKKESPAPKVVSKPTPTTQAPKPTTTTQVPKQNTAGKQNPPTVKPQTQPPKPQTLPPTKAPTQKSTTAQNSKPNSPPVDNKSNNPTQKVPPTKESEAASHKNVKN